LRGALSAHLEVELEVKLEVELAVAVVGFSVSATTRHKTPQYTLLMTHSRLGALI
jgi:hypothetical protein